MFAPFSPEENGIRGYPQGYGIRENALKPYHRRYTQIPRCDAQPLGRRLSLDRGRSNLARHTYLLNGPKTAGG